MRLADFLDPSAVKLDLAATSKDAVLDELVGLLRLEERSRQQLVTLLRRLARVRVRLPFGRHRTGLEYDAVDRRPVHVFFLIVAPPTEVSNQYLPVLGKIAQFAQMPDVPERLKNLGTVEDLFALLNDRGV